MPTTTRVYRRVSLGSSGAPSDPMGLKSAVAQPIEDDMVSVGHLLISTTAEVTIFMRSEIAQPIEDVTVSAGLLSTIVAKI